MLFNSYEFIFLFLLPLFFVYVLIDSRYRIGLLIVASIVFYIDWNLFDFILLSFSIVTNYLIVKYLLFRHRSIYLLLVVVGLNLLPLIFYKYSSLSSSLLPLGISFWTFQQITFLIDNYKGIIKPEGFGKYLFYVLFFPQLVAGPIVHYSFLSSQIERSVQKIDFKLVYDGMLLFSIGLFKKVVLVDSFLKNYSDSGGWSEVFGYSFMIYFDFSGYVDMALGLALMFGFILPENFNSPYKARNLVDFWRRWHITLSNFLRDYVYIPLGGSRVSKSKWVFNLIFTMIVGGIWHGNGWNFLLWGFLHGVGLVIVHLSKKINFFKALSIFVTFLYVSLLWVLFKSSSISEACKVYYELLEFKVGSDFVYLIPVFIIIWFMPKSLDLIKNRWFGFIAGVLFFISLKVLASGASDSFVYFNF